jgi:hypothetical protein
MMHPGMTDTIKRGVMPFLYPLLCPNACTETSCARNSTAATRQGKSGPPNLCTIAAAASSILVACTARAQHVEKSRLHNFDSSLRFMRKGLGVIS